ncbi:dihydroneopterin aldolase [Alisedimentitalea sp. MJ-SS2]|uniref:dihydroneopterin aldolase n=1 Tax=Aliisedimentitalea sp. MJ-SS2 TaxID=3049795 RepID=UPI00290D9FA2|nr:dihydroneopterin aldolase [Alisedimentitalea sp. MJ-SS2]MDU8927175.1 dihydroneopterin aldolase [Alisedimentitalea sp. MJ-SS2]
MSNEIALAFEHPDARSRATGGTHPLDRISLRDHIVEVEIGAFQQERGTTQRVCFNIVVEVRPLDTRIDDDVDRILSYDKVTEAIATELAAERLNLLETLAERIAERILLEPQAERVFVRIEKLDRGPGALGVEIVRGKDDPVVFAAPPEPGDGPHPQVVFLSNEAIAAPHLGGWLDQLEVDAAPVLLCVGPANLPAPQTGHSMTQRRVDLLAMEQNAWVLAAQDDRCVVVETRTELDWAMKHGRISVWAPSKIVLDAVDGPSVQEADAVALAIWFAREMEASGFLSIGGPLPKPECDLPCRAVAADRVQL